MQFSVQRISGRRFALLHLLMYASLLAFIFLAWHEIFSAAFQPSPLWQYQSCVLTAFLVMAMLAVLWPFLRQVMPPAEVNVLRRRWSLTLIIGLLFFFILSQLVCSFAGRTYTAIKGGDLEIVADLQASEHHGKGCRYRLEGEIFTSWLTPYACLSQQEFAGFEAGKPVSTRLKTRSSYLGFYVLSVGESASTE